MSITILTYHQVHCDGCGRLLRYGRQTAFHERTAARDIPATAARAGWIILQGRHLCPRCKDRTVITDRH